MRIDPKRLRTISITRGTLACALVLAFSFGPRALAGQERGTATPAEAPASRLVDGKRSVTLPFDLFNNTILLQARINGSRPLWMIFDTGASVTVVDERLAASLGLGASGTANLNAGGGTVDGTVATGATISLPGVDASKQVIVTAPLAELPAYFGRDLRGIIGNTFLAGFVVRIDYANTRLTFYDRAAYSLSSTRDALEIENRDGLPFIRAELSMPGGKTVVDSFEIDSGSYRSLDVNKPFAERHALLAKIPKGGVVEGIGGAGIGGRTRYLEARAQRLRLGRFTLTRPVVSFSQDTAGVGAGADAGSIGGEILRRFTVTIDYEAQRVLLVPNAHVGEPFEVDMSGLELRTNSDNFDVIEVLAVREQFPAAEAGLRAGDLLVSVNGRPASEIGLARLAARFRRAGTTYHLTVRRGETVLKTSLRTRRAV